MKTLKQLANNQVVICESTKEKTIHEFYSYGTFIARYEITPHEKSKLMLSEYYDYSRTTSKYLKIFLRDYCGIWYEDKRDLNKMIKAGGLGNVIIQVIE